MTQSNIAIYNHYWESSIPEVNVILWACVISTTDAHIVVTSTDVCASSFPYVLNGIGILNVFKKITL